MKTNLIKTMLSSTVIGLMSISSIHANETSESVADSSYIDPISSEIKESEKRLSDMTDAEKALLSNEEYTALKELEESADSEVESQVNDLGEMSDIELMPSE